MAEMPVKGDENWAFLLTIPRKLMVNNAWAVSLYALGFGAMLIVFAATLGAACVSTG
jgi:hypothetical protein